MSDVCIFSTADLAAVCGVSRTTIERWVKSGRARPAKRHGRSFVFTADEVQRLATSPRPRRGRRPSSAAA